MLVRLGITAGPIMGLAGIVSITIYTRYRLSRERHAEVLRALDARHGAG